mmetsp:Transcript_50342/g.108458  ORF Transcript_50342/g.108458 Transcript_50342/m.108458 type:complete len:906 (-) Transcript_50342:62-2779(-)|eukprot:CAMPEP_0206438014 /NCGR_PEP_ID=MMETSP0324_2-20121206/11369_1 /ASSEMBLY_ACC=CAM_ASM_000836 /TAXON_ID=2866 /ORGANISM="Crypthecodinium cohnii, Strain Seligo" /LENGTH=905 /DNA_ID=CAMNT_0053905375 /DNA_START=46 /DNA_END=2763 /DNA_ORIENTATION=-
MALPSNSMKRAAAATSRTFFKVGNVRRFAAVPNLPEEVDAVIIGGGSLGSSCAYHLQAKGLKTVLLEAHQLTAGTTWHTAGMLWRLRPSDVDVRLHTYTREMCIKLEEETGVNSWTENGGLFIACNKERLDEYKRLSTVGQYFGVESKVLSPAETKELYPIINVDDIYGAMYSPTDGTIDPAGVVNAYKRAAEKLGSKFYEHCPVENIETESYSLEGKTRRKVTAVKAAGQTIKTPLVINCTGAWANAITDMVDVKIPLRAMKHAYIVTEAIPGVHPGLPNLRDHDLSIYFKTQGDSLALGGYEQNPEFWKDVDPNFHFGLFDLDWDTFNQNLEGHIQRCPLIETLGIKSTVCGPESFTPDHKALVGPDVDLNGFFHCCGFNSMGMMLGGGVGREVAEWVVKGSPGVDMFNMDVARFHPEPTRNSRWIEDRTHESYAKTYAIVFPHDEPLSGRGVRKSGLHDVLLEQGCVYQARQAFERPGWFVPGADTKIKEYDFYGAYEGEISGLDRKAIPPHDEHVYNELIEGELTFGWGKNIEYVRNECEYARKGAAVFDQSYFGKFYLEGPDAAKATDWLCTARMDDSREIGSTAYTALCNVRGGVEADLTITKMAEDKFYFVTGGATSTHNWRWITQEIEKQGFKATLRDETENYDLISVQGPQSRAILSTIADVDMSDESIPFSHCKAAKIAGHDLHILRLTFVGELGYELHVPKNCSVEVYKALMEAGRSMGSEKGFPFGNAGYRAIDSMSAEKGLRHWHADLSNEETPAEASIGFVATAKLKTDAPFLGREALEAQQKEGLKKRLVCLTLDDPIPETPLHGLETIWANDVCVGFVRSTAYGFSTNQMIAYGYVDAPEGKALKPKAFTDWLKSQKFQIGDKLEKRDATFRQKCVFDPSNDRVKGNYS